MGRKTPRRASGGGKTPHERYGLASATKLSEQHPGFTEEALIRGISAAVLEGKEDPQIAMDRFAARYPNAKPLPVLHAIILGQREVSQAQQIATRNGFPFAERAERAIDRIATNYKDSEGGGFYLGIPTIIPHLTDPDSRAQLLTYRLSAIRGVTPNAGRVRTLLRASLRSIVESSGNPIPPLGGFDATVVMLPIAELDGSGPETGEINLTGFSGRELNLSRLIRLGPVEVHQEVGAPLNLPITSSEAPMQQQSP